MIARQSQLDAVDTPDVQTLHGQAAGASAGVSKPRNKFQGASAAAIQFSVFVTADGSGAAMPRCAQSLTLPHGSSVEVVALPNNKGIAYSALTPNGAKASGSRAVHGVGYASQTYHNLQNLCELWVYADTVGDGVLVRVTLGRG